METHRVFKTGATRDADGKLEYSNYIHPLNDYSFATYMQSKQIIGGEYRRGDNRVKGIPYDSLFESLVRHIEILKLLKQGYYVVEYKYNGNVHLSCENDYIVFHNMVTDLQGTGNTDIQVKTIESELNAIRFNSEAMKLQFITNNIIDE